MTLHKSEIGFRGLSELASQRHKREQESLCVECLRLEKDTPNEALDLSDTCLECREVIGRDLEKI